MGRVETRAEEIGRKARQTAIQLYDWDKLITPLIELFEEGENFHSVDRIPSDFKKAAGKIAGKNAGALFDLFAKITSKTREIEKEQGGSLYRPYVYDQRDPDSIKVLGLKMGRRGGLLRLATLELALPNNGNALTLSIQNTRLPDLAPGLTFTADKMGISVKKAKRKIARDEKWLDESFDWYIITVLANAQKTTPDLYFVK